jgi:hypothetical protein
MESPVHDLTALGKQLGLSSLEAFINQHAPLDEHLTLASAPFWSVAQAAFLSEQLAADADWAEVIDQLDLLLRRPR